MVTRDEVPQGKPAPDLFLEAARRLGVPPADCLGLEDSAVGLQACRRAGMIPILIPSRADAADDPAARGVRVVRDLGVLADCIETGGPTP
jgi:beta-phosphoglucomutase-like phosphatase (HAD superfamily)